MDKTVFMFQFLWKKKPVFSETIILKKELPMRLNTKPILHLHHIFQTVVTNF